MINQLLLLSWLMPIMVMPLMIFSRQRWLPVLATIPALLSVFMLPVDYSLTLSWLLLGTHLAMDEIAQWLLFASALVWAMASFYVTGVKTSLRFNVFFLMAMAGNFLLILAMDMATFYFGFALMGLSASGLIIDKVTQENKKVVGLYLKWTLAGEVILFCALILLAGAADSIQFNELHHQEIDEYILLLIVIGFGIKIALPGLHFWLPATYASLPVAGVTVFSGPMISAGVLGLIRFLSPGDTSQLFIGQILIVLGAAGVLYGVVIGLMQTRAGLALAYSSISKMGLIAAMLGIALIYPDYAPLLILAIVVYTVHHLFIKSAMFMGIGLVEQGVARAWVITGSLLLLLSLAGFPFTAGALVKANLLQAMPESMAFIALALSVAAIVSLLLISRVFYLLLNIKSDEPTTNYYGLIAWAFMVITIVSAPIFMMGQVSLSDALPLVLTLVFVFSVIYFKPGVVIRWVGVVPPGDLLNSIVYVMKKVTKIFSYISSGTIVFLNKISATNFEKIINYPVNSLSNISGQSLSWRFIGVVWALLAVLVFVVLKIA